MAHYNIEVTGSRGSVTRTGSRHSGMKAVLTAPEIVLSVELFGGWMGDNLRLRLNTQLLYEARLDELNLCLTPRSEYRKICPTLSDYKDILRYYANGHTDAGAAAKRVLTLRTPHA